jgi:hypothetical protein
VPSSSWIHDLPRGSYAFSNPLDYPPPAAADTVVSPLASAGGGAQREPVQQFPH